MNHVAIRYKKGCKVCTAVRGDAALKRRIYQTRYFTTDGTEELPDVADSYKGVFLLSSLYNHVRKHQVRLGERQKSATTLLLERRNARREALLKEEIEERSKGVALVTRTSQEKVWDEVIDLGRERLRRGELQVTLPHLLTAAKAKADYEAHKQDRSLEMAKMVFGFASGEQMVVSEAIEVTGDDDESTNPAGGASEGLDRGADEPRGIYYETLGDEAPSGADPLPSGDDFQGYPDQPAYLFE